MKIMISACLAGENCKYNGGNNRNEKVLRLMVENDVILDIAKDHGKTAAQIILRWHLQDGYIAIPGSSNPDHIAENYDIFDFELSEDEMDRIRGIDEQRRYEHW